ncbi:MAG: HdeD family acid-resistance protein [Xanthobacteraceae bacterium]
MTASDSRSGVNNAVARPLWVCVLLGVVLIAAGILVLGDMVLATIVSVTFIGLTAIAAGAFEIVHALWTRGWGGLVWQLLLGLFYLAFGLVLLKQPVAGAVVLTGVLGVLLMGSGIVRCLLSFAHWQQSGWMMLISGIFSLSVAGVLILFGWPAASIWMLGFLLGVDLISHGFAWLLYALQSLKTSNS